MEARAVLRKTRIVPRKARLTIDMIRGKSAIEAEAILTNTTNKSAPVIKGVLLSAVANAVNNLGLNKENLYVSEALIDEGPALKRVKADSRGRAKMYKRRTSHVTIVVSERN